VALKLEKNPLSIKHWMPLGFSNLLTCLYFKENLMTYPFGRNLLLSTVGFERFIDTFEKLDAVEGGSKSPSYPPYNILKKSDHDYAIEIAVAGFDESELEINAEGNKLSITGQVKAPRIGEYLHKGVATRDFSHQFTLAQTVVVRSANIVNGLLIIELENVIPEEKKPRKITIGHGSLPAQGLQSSQSSPLTAQEKLAA
jgi:molecular chaperone IbpA